MNFSREENNEMHRRVDICTNKRSIRSSANPLVRLNRYTSKITSRINRRYYSITTSTD